MIGPLANNLTRQLFTHAQPRLVHGELVDDRIGTCKIDELEYAGRITGVATVLMAVHRAVVIEKYDFAGSNVPYLAELQHVQCHAFRRYHVFRAGLGLPLTHDERADTVRVPERDDAVTDNHGDDRISAAASSVHRLDGFKDLFRCGPTVCTFL